MALKPWDEFAPEPLNFPIGGRTYTVQPLSFKDGLRLERMQREPEPDLTERDIWKLALGPTFDEMVEGGVTPRALARAGLTALIDHQRGREAAEYVWENGLDPEALAAAAAANQEQSETDSTEQTTSTGTEEAPRTPSPASGSGTRTSRRKQAEPLP